MTYFNEIIWLVPTEVEVSCSFGWYIWKFLQEHSHAWGDDILRVVDRSRRYVLLITMHSFLNAHYIYITLSFIPLEFGFCIHPKYLKRAYFISVSIISSKCGPGPRIGNPEWIPPNRDWTVFETTMNWYLHSKWIHTVLNVALAPGSEIWNESPPNRDWTVFETTMKRYLHSKNPDWMKKTVQSRFLTPLLCSSTYRVAVTVENGDWNQKSCHESRLNEKVGSITLPYPASM